MVLERIEMLRIKKTPNEIERVLLNEELGKIRTDPNGYQYIGNILFSWLVVEAHRSGFIEWMLMHPYKLVVHHIDGNPLNNVYENLRVMKWSDHSSLHHNDPKFAETTKVGYMKITAYYVDPVNAEAIKSRNKKHSAYFTDPKNAKAIKAAGKAISKAQRKNNGWLTPNSDPEFFEDWFAIEDYAEASKIYHTAAYDRLSSLLRNNEIVCEKKLIGGKWCNIYRKGEENACS